MRTLRSASSPWAAAAARGLLPLPPLLLLVLCCACAHPAASGRGEGDGAAAAGFLQMPPALRVDPASVKIPELTFQPPQPRVEKLPNGLTVYLLEDRTVPLIQLHALVRLGTLDDPPDQAGLVSATWAALETGGAGSLGAHAVDEALEDMAALKEAGVDDESASLVLEARTADLDQALALFADLLRRPRFEKAAVDRVLARARDAVVRRRDDAGQVAQLALLRALWGPSSPFARQPTLESLSRIGPEDIARLHREAVVPAATRLIVTGDFEAASMLERLKARFGDWTGGPGLTRRLPPPPPLPARQVILVPTVGAQARVRLGHLGPARHDPRELALRLLDSVLGAAPGPSRLYTDIRDQRGLAYTVESAIGGGPVRGLVLVAADTRPENAREVIARCLAALEAARSSAPPTEEEIAFARESYVNAFAFGFDPPARAAYQRAKSDLEGYPPDYLSTLRERLAAVPAAQVVAAAREVLQPASLQIVVVGDPKRIGDLSEFGPVKLVLGEQHADAAAGGRP